MRPWRASTPVKFPVGLKFAGAVALGELTVAVTAGIGLGQLQSDVERLISDDLASVRVVDDLAISVYLSEEAVLAEQAAAGPDRTPVTTLLDSCCCRASPSSCAPRGSGSQATRRRPST
jgi:hypothetical protein